jgi:hypothetical protein
MNKLVLAMLATAFTANVAIADSIVEVNGVLADAAGRTLYTFDKDADNKSNCNGGCAAAWPPYLVKEGDRNPANIGVVRRDDNTLQWLLTENLSTSLPPMHRPAMRKAMARAGCGMQPTLQRCGQRIRHLRQTSLSGLTIPTADTNSEYFCFSQDYSYA